MSVVDERNERAKEFVLAWLSRASKFSLTPALSIEHATELRILNALIPIKQNGFRGIVLTAIVGKYLNKTFNALENFYACNPRSIFEHGIYYALKEARIPCGKSDPLNVAKNIQRLDYGWAQGRRPEAAARAAVDYLTLLEQNFGSKDRYELLLMLYFHTLHQYGLEVNSQNIEFTIEDRAIPLHYGELLADFVLECPEGGTVTQFVVGLLIASLRQGDSKVSSVEGVHESVFGTNTTSKKPADVWEINSDGQLGGLYEITVKVIDRKRLDDCVESLRTLGIGDKAVTFICNLPNDVEGLGLPNRHLVHQGIAIQFLDIRHFVEITYCMLTDAQQVELFETIQEFVSDPNRPIKTKQYWKNLVTS